MCKNLINEMYYDEKFAIFIKGLEGTILFITMIEVIKYLLKREVYIKEDGI